MLPTNTINIPFDHLLNYEEIESSKEEEKSPRLINYLLDQPSRYLVISKFRRIRARAGALGLL